MEALHAFKLGTSELHLNNYDIDSAIMKLQDNKFASHVKCKKVNMKTQFAIFAITQNSQKSVESLCTQE